MNATQRKGLAMASTLAVLLTLAGCNRPADGGLDQRVNSSLGKAERAGADAKGAAEDSSTSAASANAAADNARAMGASAGEKVDDATITAKVNASLAQDKELSAIRIDVDTQNGVVTLSGPAPTATAKERAGEVARTVRGVTSVNNQLTIKSG